MFTRSFLGESLGRLIPEGQNFSRIWSDSRSIQSGDLFVAVPGEKFDGHDFVAAAAEVGALGALVSKSSFKDKESLPQDFCLIEVSDTTEALRSIAKAHRQRLQCQIFAVAGSNGKTTTKEWIAYILGILHGPDQIFKTLKSNNSILGIALTLLQIRSQPYAVIEIGIDEPGWMEKHLEIVQPDAGLITTIEEEHLENLKNIETVAEEELKLLGFLRLKSGKFAANLDSPWISSQRFPPQTLTYSLDGPSHIEGKYVPPRSLLAFGLTFLNPLAGKHNAQNLLAGLTAARLLHPSLDQASLKTIAEQTTKFAGEAHRSLWLEFGRDVRVFDDCYNANPSSMEKALETFVEVSRGCKQKLVLGDMRDLGEARTKAHVRILNLAMVSEFDEIFLYGEEFARAWLAASKLPLPSERLKVSAFTDFDSLKRAVRSSIMPADCYFVKGSRSMGLERILPVFEEVAGKK